MGSKSLQMLHKVFPGSLKQARTLKAIDVERFTKFVMCGKCHTTYQYSDCIGPNGVSSCKFIRFPRHPQKRMRLECSFPLLKNVKTPSGKLRSIPSKIFCYRSIIEAIETFVNRPGMLETFNHWRSRKIPAGVLADIYDGVVWKSFLGVDGEPFFSSQYCLGLLINIDWFQPYKHIQYSVGAIYIAILNFPRALRYRKENMILVGVIPGPHEPALHINTFLEQLVHDLLKLWHGVEMQTCEGPQIIRAAVLCNSSDIPATRKVGGFVGHGARKGCSRCLKNFPVSSFGEKADYSGFDSNTWPPRSLAEHKTKALEWKHAKTLSVRQKIEQEYGVRYTELLRLPYFDTVRFSVVDPMHNILLGTTKLMVTLWKENGLLSSNDFSQIQAHVDRFIIPPDVGRIPNKISSGFSSFTADQWKNWAVLYSLIVLKSRLPSLHYEAWLIFVKACLLLSSRAISHENISCLHSLLVSFCRAFESIYGSNSCTPNLHLHCHLHECIKDFGPANAFWLFACERLNGILGSVPTNHHSIETQLMRKFSISQQAIIDMEGPEIKGLLESFHFNKGSLKHEDLFELPLLERLSCKNVQDIKCSLINPIKEGCLSSDEHEAVDKALHFFFNDKHERTLLLYKYSSAIHLNGEVYGSLDSLHSSSALVYARPTSTVCNALPGFVLCYLTLNLLLKDDEQCSTKHESVVFAHILWLNRHEHKDWFGAHVEVWRKFSRRVSHGSFIPVSDILCRCAYVDDVIHFSDLLIEEVTVIIPLNNFNGL